ncbi:MAG: hypothetical protein QM756_35450 [Polyangiaceae bacterium]
MVSDGAKIDWASTASNSILSCPVSGCTAPQVFAKEQATPRAPSLRGKDLYWIAGDSVRRAPTDGSAPAVNVVANLNQPAALSLNSSYVSFTTNYSFGEVGFCPLEGCASAPDLLAKEQAFPFSVASDESHVYWINASSMGSARGASLMRADFAGATEELAPISVRNRSDDPIYEHSLVVDEAYVYWISPGALSKTGYYPNAGIFRRGK